jgi:sodium transport system permease protein
LLPSMLLGWLLAWVCWQSGSLFPGMVLHVLHNGFNLLLSRFGEEWAESGWVPSEFLSTQDLPPHLPPEWLAGSAVCVVAGAGLVWLGRYPLPTRGVREGVSEGVDS